MGCTCPDLSIRMSELKFGPVTQYADIGPESATNRARFGPGPVPGRHPVLGGGIGGLRQLGAEPVL